MKTDHNILPIAIALGIISYFLGGTFFLFFVFGSIGYCIYTRSSLEDRAFIIKVLIAGFLLRVLFAVVFHGANFAKGYHGISGDDLLYTVKSWALVFKWEGKPDRWADIITSASSRFGLNPFTYLMAIFYKIFGFHPVEVKVINCILGSLIGWVTYLTAAEIFDKRAAKISMCIVMFWPSLIRWSIANLKDPLIILSFMVCIYILISALQRKIEIWRYIIFLLSATIIFFFTPQLYFILIAGGAGLLIMFRALRSMRSKRIIYLLVAAAALLVVAGVYYFSYVKPHAFVQLIYKCELNQYTISGSDFAGYYFYPGTFVDNLSREIVSLPVFADIIFKNVVYFMLTPFPWQITSPERLLSFPQMMLWYVLLILSFFGIARLFTRRGPTAFFISILLGVGVIVSALAEGNIGSALRHRDIFTPFFVILASTIISDMIFDKRLSKEGAE